MKRLANFLVIVVAVIHLAIMAAEMFGRAKEGKVFGWPPLLLARLDEDNKLGFAKDQAEYASPIVWNTGLFNGFLAAGLFWGWKAKVNALQVRAFFLGCVTIAGVFGACTLPVLTTLWIQAIPGGIALIVNCLALRGGTQAT